MTTAEKLDFLMKLTNTRNTALGRALNFDASYISRIRRGKRGLPPKQPFLGPAAAYFAARIKEDYQKSAAAERAGFPWPEEERAAAAMLLTWLEAGCGTQAPVVWPPVSVTGSGRSAPQGGQAEALLFYGSAGKRKGVLTFLDALCETGRAHTLLLHSDEDMSWLYEDGDYSRAWAALLIRLIENGGRIRIIHSINRDANEMWEAVRKWLPLYLKAAVEPYYYPRLRDGVYHRTLFVAPGHSAFTSTSVQEQEGDALNLLLRDSGAVSALEREFLAYLRFCRPLMEVSRPAELKEAAPLFHAFQEAPGTPLAVFRDNTAICLKEGYGALIAATAPPYALFSLTEPRMVAAVEEYLHNLPGGPDTEAALAEIKKLLG